MNKHPLKMKIIREFEEEINVVKDGNDILLQLPFFDFFGDSIMLKVRTINNQIELSDLGHVRDTLWMHSVSLPKEKVMNDLKRIFSVTFENGKLIMRTKENLFYAIMDMIEVIQKIQKRVINISNPLKDLEQDFVSIVRKDLDKQGLVSHTHVKIYAEKADVMHTFWLQSHKLLIDPLTAWSTRSANSRLKSEFIKVYDVFGNGTEYAGIVLLDDRETDIHKKRKWDRKMIKRIKEYAHVFQWKQDHENYLKHVEEIAPKYGQFLIPK